jgi:hypothetical protein
MKANIGKFVTALSAIALIGMVAGCSQKSSATTSPATATAAQRIQEVQNNPNIPPQARAAIVHNWENPPSMGYGGPVQKH